MLLKHFWLLSMLKTVAMCPILVETLTDFFKEYLMNRKFKRTAVFEIFSHFAVTDQYSF